MINLRQMADLTTLYTQPHRYYHNINHINDCLVELASVRHELSIRDQMIIERAIWYHDAVYNPYSKTNEADSAALVQYDGEFRSDMASETQAVILATKDHLITQPNLKHTVQYMLDIDLSGFGKPWHICKAHADNIRKEYYHTTDEEFYIGRLNFLEAINKRETLYYTDFFRNKYHEQSKINLVREIDDTHFQLENIR